VRIHVYEHHRLQDCALQPKSSQYLVLDFSMIAM